MKSPVGPLNDLNSLDLETVVKNNVHIGADYAVNGWMDCDLRDLHGQSTVTASTRRETFSNDSSLLNVSGEKGNDGTGACDGDGEPDDAPKRPTKPILLPHGDQREDDAG